MSKPVFEDIFSFSGRRDRASYNWFQAALLVAFLVISPTIVLSRVLWIILFIPILVSAWAVTAQRVRDLGYSGWFALLTLIPYAGVVVWFLLCIQRGTGDNTYGPAIVAGTVAPEIKNPGWNE